MPLLPAPHRPNPPDRDNNHLDKAPGIQPPPTPRPTDLPPASNRHRSEKDSGEKTLVLHPPPQPKKETGKRGRDDDRDPGPSDPKKGAESDQGPDQHPVEGPEGPTDEKEKEAPKEGGEGDPDQPPEEEPLGEGQVEGHPPPRPPNGEHGPQNGQEESLLTAVASHLVTWEQHFKQLVEDIRGDLEDYWQKLMIPQ